MLNHARETTLKWLKDEEEEQGSESTGCTDPDLQIGSGRYFQIGADFY